MEKNEKERLIFIFKFQIEYNNNMYEGIVFLLVWAFLAISLKWKILYRAEEKEMSSIVHFLKNSIRGE